MLPVVGLTYFTRPHIPETEIKQNCRRSAETKNSRPSAVLFYFSFISPCATGLICDQRQNDNLAVQKCLFRCIFDH